jgi:hypothetical protein
LPLLGVHPGDTFENDWVTRFDPVSTVYTLRWYAPGSRKPRPLGTRFSIFMVPEDEKTTVFHTFLHVHIEPGPFAWIAPIVKAVALYLGHREIAYDGRFIPTVADTPFPFDGMRLGKFDRPLVHNHRLLRQVYWGIESAPAAESHVEAPQACARGQPVSNYPLACWRTSSSATQRVASTIWSTATSSGACGQRRCPSQMAG